MRFLYRSGLIAVFPFVFTYSVLVEFLREQKHALTMTWLHARAECEAFMIYWNKQL